MVSPGDRLLTSPRLVAHRYRIREELGRGGSGLVYVAHDERLGRDVALKTLHAAGDAGTRERMWREARAAASLSHPNVCQLYDLVEDEGELFLAMELLSGEPLEARLRGGALPVEQALAIAQGILAALGALHEHGIVHRDLKPSNVILAAHGVKVLDFGLAFPIGGDETRLTIPGSLVGTPRYMAPEQWGAGTVSPATDLFVCGVLLFEMLSGRPAFTGDSVGAFCHAILSSHPPALSGGPRVEAIDRVLRRALAKKPAERWASATAMATALREADEGALESRLTEGQKVRAVTRLMVLPFRLLRPDPEIDFLSFGLADGLTVALGGLPQLVVRSSLSAGRLADGSPDLAALGERSEVDAVLFGTLLRAGERVRLQTQLLAVPGGTVLSTATAQATREDIFALQDELTQAVVQALSLSLNPREDRQLQAGAPANGRAYELYLRGNDVRAGVGSASQLVVARDLYRGAIEADPGFAPAWARLGRCYRVMGKFGHADPDECRRLAADAFRHALELSPDLPLTHNLYTYLELEDPGGGLLAMRRLLGQVAAGVRDPQLYAGLVVALRMCGLLEASLAADREARRLDPQVRTSVHYTYLAMGDYARAMATDEDDVPGVRWLALAELGREAEAIAGLRELEERHVQGATYLASLQASLERDRGRLLEALRHPTAITFRDPEGIYVRARSAARMGEDELALSMLERAAAGFWSVTTWERDPAWDSIRDSQRFAAMLALVRAGHERARQAFAASGGEKLLGMQPATPAVAMKRTMNPIDER